jgi:hypothetical protein
MAQKINWERIEELSKNLAVCGLKLLETADIKRFVADLCMQGKMRCYYFVDADLQMTSMF